jgi:hypothetical protein
MHTGLRDQIKASHLFDLCNRVLATDEIWSSRLADEGPDFGEGDRHYLARLGQDMASDVALIRHYSDLVLRLLDVYVQTLRQNSDPLKTLSQHAPILANDPARVISGVKLALEHLETHGPDDIEDLRKQARRLISVEGGMPVGDLPRRTWGAIAAIGGFVMLVGAVPMILCGGVVGVAAGGAVLALGSILLTKGLDLVTEQP